MQKFHTSNGSIYDVLPENKTKRFKASTNETFNPSDITVYINVSVAYLLSGAIGTATITLENNVIKVGAYGKIYFDVKYSKEPQVGLHPVEFWFKKRKKKKELEFIHIGNTISEVWK